MLEDTRNQWVGSWEIGRFRWVTVEDLFVDGWRVDWLAICVWKGEKICAFDVAGGMVVLPLSGWSGCDDLLLQWATFNPLLGGQWSFGPVKLIILLLFKATLL